MRRVVLALAVTVAAVVWLASYRTHPARHANPRAGLPPPERHAPPARPRPRPDVRIARGPVITTPFSVIQVEATLTRGRLTRVRTVALSGDGPHTNALNARAEPILRREALRARSAEIDVVSGATYTSQSWRDSLAGAIEAARSPRRTASG